MSNEVLKPLVESEGYCCLYGYLKLCRARGQTDADMADHMGVARSTIRYNYYRLREDKRSHRCEQALDCMKDELNLEEVKL